VATDLVASRLVLSSITLVSYYSLRDEENLTYIYIYIYIYVCVCVCVLEIAVNIYLTHVNWQ
jgi:hypothetical protein